MFLSSNMNDEHIVRNKEALRLDYTEKVRTLRSDLEQSRRISRKNERTKHKIQQQFRSVN